MEPELMPSNIGGGPAPWTLPLPHDPGERRGVDENDGGSEGMGGDQDFPTVLLFVSGGAR